MKEMHRTIWFVRHGERVDNVHPKWAEKAKRWDDPPLSYRGTVQAQEVGVRLADEKIEHIFCSPFTRCLETAHGITKNFAHNYRIYIEPGLSESMNACNSPPGWPSEEETSSIINPEKYVPVIREMPPEQECDAGCIQRVGLTLRNILHRFPHGNILIVSHASPIAACHVELFRTWNYVGQCTLGKVIQTGNDFEREFYGDTGHLSDRANLRDIQSPTKLHATHEYLRSLSISSE